MLRSKSQSYTSGDILISEQRIKKRLKEMAQEIGRDYQQKEFVLVGILKGACILVADLQRALYKEDCTRFQLSFISLKSYFSKKTSSRRPQLMQKSDIDLQGKHVLVVDEIVDTGRSLQYVVELMKKQGVASVRVAVLLSKPERREVSYEPEYVGFVVPDVWLEGYGMDSAENGRGNPNIIIRK